MDYKNENRICQNCKSEFVIEKEDFNFYEKIKVPPPTFCPECRSIRRMIGANERVLYKRICDMTREQIFSMYDSNVPFPVYETKKWYSDEWDPCQYGMDYDFSKSFFEQFQELVKKVPRMALVRQGFSVNSEYTHRVHDLKNCYLVFRSSDGVDSSYIYNATDISDCVDCFNLNKCEFCYECIDCSRCYKVKFSKDSMECRDSFFLYNCRNCVNCVGCVNLRNQEYCIFNQKYTKEEYQKEIKNMKLDAYSGIIDAREKARAFWKTFPVKNHQGIRNMNSTGSYVTDCRNVNESFLMREGENIKYSQYLQVPKNKDCYDAFAWGANMEMHYETCLSGGNTFNLKFCDNCWPNCSNLEYCINMFSSSDCFGCVGLKKKQYCILNKQYTKEKYEKLVPIIKKHMSEMPYFDAKGLVYKYGEFFPIEFSSFGYNNTTAIQYFPMTKEKAQENGYLWVDVPRGEYKITKIASELPDSIDDVDGEISKEVIECENCKNPYRILENEFNFYKKEKMPIPRMCNECRFKRRTEDRLKFNLYDRVCMCGGASDTTLQYKNTVKHIHGDAPCGEEFKTGYAPDKPEIVYCEKCYQQEVY